MSFLVDKAHITEYIPQKPPIVMINTIVSCDDVSVTTQFEVQADNIFVRDNFLQEPGVIENMAQTAAAKAGYEAKKLNAEPFLGFIGAIKDLKIHTLPKVGDTIKTTVTVKMDVMGITLIGATSVCGDIQIAECEMKIVIQKTTDVPA
ncbi:MAG TPA: 3-hydroxyacyl-ACP dehydratase [Bacteroidia bacterium]|nr:3-hydroxyacyl-ACP dehydratase [Bacteroidia bacterium]